MEMPKVIMFIDDDDDDINTFCEACGVLDSSIIRLTCNSASEALDMLAKPDAIIPDFIFLDIYMPVMNGKECFCELRKLDKLRSVPIIMCSVSKYTEDQEECARLGADFYLIKPNTMLHMINSLLYVFDTYHNKTIEKGATRGAVSMPAND